MVGGGGGGWRDLLNFLPKAKEANGSSREIHRRKGGGELKRLLLQRKLKAHAVKCYFPLSFEKSRAYRGEDGYNRSPKRSKYLDYMLFHAGL